MPTNFLTKLTGNEGIQKSNTRLVRCLAFVAGAVNAGGFLAVHQYTSHMSGIVSAMADNLALGSMPLVLAGLSALFAFLLGSACTGFLVRWTRRRHIASEFAFPLLLEAALLIVFGMTGRVFQGHRALDTVVLLCFTMGLQNAIVTRISGTVVRTTHLTGMITDLGIKLGRMAYSLFLHEKLADSVQLVKLTLLSSLVAMFFLGGVTGALGYKHVGFLFTLPLAAVLVLLAASSLLEVLQKQDSASP